ncbi:MAG: hypothetical protein LBL46_03230 [Rickettsiales bacterium]|nr:hypothetical protein [Rickettsiales bacterium]
MSILTGYGRQVHVDENDKRVSYWYPALGKYIGTIEETFTLFGNRNTQIKINYVDDNAVVTRGGKVVRDGAKAMEMCKRFQQIYQDKIRSSRESLRD